MFGEYKDAGVFHLFKSLNDTEPLNSKLSITILDKNEIEGGSAESDTLTFKRVVLKVENVASNEGLMSGIHPAIQNPLGIKFKSDNDEILPFSKRVKTGIEEKSKKLSASYLLTFFEGHMKDNLKLNSIPHIIDNQGLEIPLFGRDDTLKQAANCMRAMSLPVGKADKAKHKDAGRMEKIFDLANINEPQIGILIPYYNGHAPHPAERQMTIDASFSWRMLHRYFIEGNGSQFNRWFSDSLPLNAEDLTFMLALDVIRQKHLALGLITQNETLNIFIGVDEYQSISKIQGKKTDESTELLQDLLDVLGNVLACPVDGVRIYPMFAGTDFSIISIVNSSKTETLRMPMYLLTPASVEDAISSVRNGSRLLNHAPVRRHLFYFGGVPRWMTQYFFSLLDLIETLPADEFLTVEAIESTFDLIWDCYVTRWGKNLNDIDFIKLAAQAISGVPVNLVLKEINGMTWARVIDSSLCLLNTRSQILVPYAIFRLIAMYKPSEYSSPAIRAFIRSLKGLIEKVDSLIYDKAPWQLWEVFGAYYHALRINALIIISGSICHVKDCFKGALINNCDDEVELQPMLVIETEDKFSSEIGEIFGRKGHHNEWHNWLKDGYIVSNGEGGEGIDLFFALKKHSSPGYVLFTDQRKRFGDNNLGVISVSKLLQRARIIPDALKSECSVVACLFSCITYANVKAQDLPKDSVVVSLGQYERYHGTLSTHPASYPFVKINTDPITFIQMILVGKEKHQLATAILAQRRRKAFQSDDELKMFVDNQKLEAFMVNDFQERVSYC